MTSQEFDCHKIAEGAACAQALISNDDICFYMIDPKTGIVIEKGHELEGKSVAGSVLIFPSGKGSSVVQADGLYQLQLHGTAPKAMIIKHADTVLVASANQLSAFRLSINYRMHSMTPWNPDVIWMLMQMKTK